MKKIIIILILFTAGAVFRTKAQYGFGTNTPDPAAIIDANVTDKGILIPRVALSSASSYSPLTSQPPASMLVWNDGTGALTPAGFYYWSGGATGPWKLLVTSDGTGASGTWGINVSGTSSNVTGTVAISNGGTGATSQQTAINNLAGAVTSGQYLRGNGTNIVMSGIQASDVPTLNQNTTGSAATLTTARNFSITGDVTVSAVSFNGSGDVALSSAIANNAVTSAKINDGTIVNADISSTAQIAVTKLASGTSNGQVLTYSTSGGISWAAPSGSSTAVYGELYLPYSATGVEFRDLSNTIPETIRSGVVTGYQAGETSGVTVNAANGTITVPSDGYYIVTIQASFRYPGSQEGTPFRGFLYIGTNQNNKVVFCQYGGNDYGERAGNGNSSGILSLTAGDVLTFRVLTSTNNHDPAFYSINFRIQKIN